MKKILSTAFVALCAASAFAAITYWRGGDGAWNDPNMWTHGVPDADTQVQFKDGIGGRVTLTGECLCSQFLVGTQNKVSEEDAPVVICGGGTLSSPNIPNVYPGRTLIITNATFITTASTLTIAGDGDGGATVKVRAGGILDCPRIAVGQGAALFVDGGEVSGNLTLNGMFRMTAGSYRLPQKFPTIGSTAKLDITGGTFIYGEEMRAGQVFTSDAVGFFPRTPNAKLIVSVPTNADGFSVNLENSPDGVVYRLAGTVSLTNYVTDANFGTFASTSNMVFYGGGTLAANWICQRRFQDFDFGLSRVLLGSGLRSGSSTSEYRFHGDVEFGAYSDWRWDSGNYNHTEMLLYGDVTFDTDDCFDASAPSHTLCIPPFSVGGGSVAVSFVGGGDVRCRFYSVPTAPLSIRALSFADGMDVAFSDIAAANNPGYMVRDFKAGANTRFVLPVKCVNSISNVNFTCLNTTEIDPSAQFTAIYENRSAVAGTFYNVFTAAPGGDWPDPAKWTLVRADADSGTESVWEMRVVGPTVYLRDGNKTPYSGNAHWIGAVDGNLSTAGNWSNGSSANNSLWFSGEQNTIVTNDRETLTIKGIRVAGDAGPFVVRGNKLTVNRSTGFGESSATVYHGGAFPLVIECDLTMAINAWVSVDSAGYVAFMGDVALGNCTLNMRGEMLVGSTFAMGDLNPWNKLSTARATVFHVAGTGDVRVSNQVSAFTNTACMSVCGGGKMRFEGGNFRYAKVANTHLVDGLLDIAVPFFCGADDAGTAASDIGFEGTGVVRIASVKSSSLGNSAVKLNGKVNLVPPATGWTTVTADATDTALTLALPEWGRATLAPTNDFVYGPANGVTPSTVAADRAFACGRFSELTVDSDYAVAFADPLVFAPYSTLVKKGAGTLSFTTGNDVFPETLKVEAGTFAWSVPVAVTNLEVAAGAKLAFGSVAGVVSPISVAENVSLDGVVIEPADAATRMALSRGTTVIEVPAYRKITGTPVCGPLMKLSVASTASGGMALKASPIFGAQFIVR